MRENICILNTGVIHLMQTSVCIHFPANHMTSFSFTAGNIPWHAYAASSLPRVGHLGWSRDLAVVKCCGTHGCASVCVVS